MREPFLERIEKRIVVCDGAMGTMLYSKGISFSRCFDELNLSAPQLVKDVHLAYVKAGSEVLETNTFGATKARLEKYDLAPRVRDINLAAAKLAREIAGENLYVAGAVGPLGIPLEPLGPTSLAEARAQFREQIEALVQAGVDLIVIETMLDLGEARQAVLAALEVSQLPVVVQMTVEEDGNTPTGTGPEEFARELDACGAHVIGLNCSMGPAGMLETIERMSKVTAKKLSAQPNAGLPRTVDGRSIYLCSPDYMAEYASRFIDHGVRLIGGCCGTTPDHIRAIKTAVRSLQPIRKRARLETPLREAPAHEPAPIEKRSHLGEKLARGEFAVLIEMIPPKGCDATRELEGARFLESHGVGVLNVPDGQGSTARMSAQTLATLLQERAGIEALLHYSCRGRNILSIQSDLLGAYALGIKNILAVTGEPSQFTAYPGATTVLDVDSIGLVNILSNLNRGLDIGGNPLGTPTGFLIGVRANPGHLKLDEEVRRFEYKVEAGANFAITQPIFDPRQLEQFLKRIEVAGALPVPILAGILPLTSFRNAEFLNNEVPGISVPQEILDRMRRADSGDQARAEGLKIAQELLLKIKGIVQGIQISAPFGRYALALEVAQAADGAVLNSRGK
ncbi:MAG: bifunctional homocysteine S-methyltransferase/methylenetetrahydrofolate reductase [Terriglobia bacterium]